jgi:magnesium chelatase subunit I
VPVPERADFPLLPYSYVVGQDDFRRLLAIAYVMGSEGGGVLVSGERGTAKSTIARSFAYMMYEQLPVTLPINATDDRIIGGWEINSLLRGDEAPEWKEGLLRLAGDVGMLYIDEVNLLEDHIINLILDVVSTGVLTVERDGIAETDTDVAFMLVGTMNPDEGPLRPQLLDRFGLFMPIQAERDRAVRRRILVQRLKFDVEREKSYSSWLREGRQEDLVYRTGLEAAKKRAAGIDPTAYPHLLDACARVAEAFDVVGHRAELVIARAACAAAAIDENDVPTSSDVAGIAQYAVRHRRHADDYTDGFAWSEAEEQKLAQVLAEA